LHRGISYLATPQAIRSVADLVRLSTEAEAVSPADADEVS
jgi:hypothetical protein